MTAGPLLFDKFLTERGIKRSAAATQLNTSVSAIHYWIKGGQRPRADVRSKIERWSGGEVPASSWLTEEESEQLSSMEPAPEKTDESVVESEASPKPAEKAS
jgi:hypothetical protein